MIRFATRSVSLTGFLLWAGMASAQSMNDPAAHADHRNMPGDAVAHAATDAAMAGALHDGVHMRLTPTRVPTAEDSLRADSIVFVLRDAIEKYRDVRVAEADGYRIFAPAAPQRVYHFTRWENAVRAELAFDAARPTSLLYTKDSTGRFHLIGAMFTAPARSSDDDLNARVPLGIARWHLHTNICLPRRLRDRSEWARTRNGLPLFGPASPIATEDECRVVGGRFRERVFNWMVHVNVFTSDAWSEHSH
ncbi:MAG TPA: hypothetical protein VFK04_11170 [Gemmatimonadaceae bacterium]|nr:hypothetical protein [Gemmatimonadaceae bacterium]